MHGENLKLMGYYVYFTERQNIFTFILIEMLGWWCEIVYL